MQGEASADVHGRILVVDDEEILREVLGELLAAEGHEPELAATGEQALELLRETPVDVVVLDIMLPGIGGIQTLEQIKRLDPDLPVVMLTAYGSVETAIAAMKQGAFEYITKPFKNDETLAVIGNAVRQRRLVEENRRLKRTLKEQYSFNAIVGKNHRMQRIFRLIEQVAPSRSTVLIVGESGTGKELVAKAIHHNSTRADRSFVTVNSGSMPSDLLESNLFGHVKGSFTGAIATKKGLFQVADQGTIFFDEIGTVGIDTQSKLLRVIQEREFMPIGGIKTQKVDVRILAATNVDLKEQVLSGTFREDLYYRLNVITIELPPLRERKDDIPLLANHFLQKYARENQRKEPDITPQALQLLLNYDWPGNVRELENVIERAIVLGAGDQIGPELIPDPLQTGAPPGPTPTAFPGDGMSFKEAVSQYEAALLLKALDAADGVQKRAAELLQLKPTTFNEMLKRHGIRPSRH